MKSELTFDCDMDNEELSLDNIEIILSEYQEQQLAELIELQRSTKNNTDVLNGLFEAVKKGSTDYLNSFVDTSEIVSDLKNPAKIKIAQSQEIKYTNTSTKPHEEPNYRTLGDAKNSPYSADSKVDCTKMSERGREKWAKYEKIYSQRTKTVGVHKQSKSLNSDNSNLSLAGLNSYKIGPSASCYTAEEFKTMYNQERPNNVAYWVRAKNYKNLYSVYRKEFGFKSDAAVKDFLKNCKLTPHETPDGIFLIPTDVHNKESHAGLQSAVNRYITGKISADQLRSFELNYKVKYITTECKVRGTRAVKGAIMSSVVIILKKSVSIITTESYKEFKNKSEESLFIRLRRIMDSCIYRIKTELRSLWGQIQQGWVMGGITELFNVLNDFIFKTAKNIFKIIRAMSGSIISALKIIFSKETSWEDKFFEASKILTAGFIAAVGFSLNEIIENLIVTSVPIFAPVAPFIADISSGLLAGIMSAIVLFTFDSWKQSIQTSSLRYRENLLQTNLICTNNALISLSSLRATAAVTGAYSALDIAFEYISPLRDDVAASQNAVKKSIGVINDAVNIEKQRGERLKKLKQNQ